LEATPAYSLTRSTFTGQYSHMDDPTTKETEGFGLMFYNARYYDPALGRFAQADSIIPAWAQGLDRYAYVNNSPVNFTDPSGHKICDGKDQSNCRTLKGNFGIHLTGGFTSEQKKAIRQAVEDVGYALWGYIGNSPWEAFEMTMGSVNFVFDEAKQIDGWAITEIDTITFDNSINTERASIAGIIRTVTHEFGHILDVRTGLSGSGSMWTTINDLEGKYVTGVNGDGIWVRKNAGYGSDSYPDQMHPADKNGGQSTIEEFADMFMNWVYDSFAQDAAGDARFGFMTTNMADWVSSASR